MFSWKNRWPRRWPTPSAWSPPPRANGRKLVIGYILRHHPSWMRLIAEARALGGPYVFRMNLNQQSSGADLGDAQAADADHLADRRLRRPLSRRHAARSPTPGRSRCAAWACRLSDEIAPEMYNYGHLQVLFDDGSVGWYEAGWGPMMSETAFFVKDVISPNGCVSIVMDEERQAPTTWTPTPRPIFIRVHRAATVDGRQFRTPDEMLSMSGEPDHQALCDREQAFLLAADPRGPRSYPPYGRCGALAGGLPGRRPERAQPACRSGCEKETPPVGSLKLDSVRKSFGKVDVLKGIDLDVADGEFVVFVGPSGCGKSTLLRIIAGLEDLTSGDVMIDGGKVDTVPPAKRGIAMVFQTYALYPHLTVRDNMGLGLKQAGAPAAEIARRIAEAAGMLSLEPYLERRPAELSGGQRQRVAIGRALVREPKLFLFDEPLSNLDAALRVNTRLEIAQLHRRLRPP